MSNQLNGNQIQIGRNNNTEDFGNGKNVPNINVNDSVPESIDKIVKILDLLAPAKSPNLSTKVLNISSKYSARHVSDNVLLSGTTASYGSLYNNIINITNPTFIVTDSSSSLISATFSDGQLGQLSAFFQSGTSSVTLLGTKTITNVSDVGTYNSAGTIDNTNGGLRISFDSDPYSSAPNAGFWTSLKAEALFIGSNIGLITDNGIENRVTVEHSTTGTAPISFFYNSPTASTTPTNTIATCSISATQSNTIWKTGIPSLNVGDIISANYTLNNNGSLISRFYNSNRITQFNGFISTLVSKIDTIGNVPAYSPPLTAYQSTYSVTGITISVPTNSFTNDVIFTINTYNVIGNTSQISLGTFSNYGITNKRLYVDTTTINGNRVRSGSITFSTFGTNVENFGVSYDNTISLLDANYNTELMFSNGNYRYPTGNYTNNHPVSGYDYSSITGFRYATFNIGSITNASSVTFDIVNSTGLGLSTIITGLKLYLKIEGSLSTGWLDANSAFSAGNPIDDEDSALNLGASTVTRKVVTFGTLPKTGNIYIKIGFNNSSNFTFTNITLV